MIACSHAKNLTYTLIGKFYQEYILICINLSVLDVKTPCQFFAETALATRMELQLILLILLPTVRPSTCCPSGRKNIAEVNADLSLTENGTLGINSTVGGFDGKRRVNMETSNPESVELLGNGGGGFGRRSLEYLVKGKRNFEERISRVGEFPLGVERRRRENVEISRPTVLESLGFGGLGIKSGEDTEESMPTLEEWSIGRAAGAGKTDRSRHDYSELSKPSTVDLLRRFGDRYGGYGGKRGTYLEKSKPTNEELSDSDGTELVGKRGERLTTNKPTFYKRFGGGLVGGG